MPVEISVLRAMAFDASPNFPDGNWVRSVLSASSRYTVTAVSTSEVTLTATAASQLPGYKVVLKPVTTFTATPGGAAPMDGAIREAALYDGSGVLVSKIAGLPSVSFAALGA